MMTIVEWGDVGLAVVLVVMTARSVWKSRQIDREWHLLTQAQQGMTRSWGDANMLWSAEVAYSEQLNQLMRAVRLAAGRRALEDPRVRAAIAAADDALDTVLAQSAHHADTPAGDGVPQPALLGRLTSPA